MARTHILQIVSGDIIDFSDHPLINHKATNPSSAEEEGIIDMKLNKMMLKRVIIPCGQERIECVSPIFITPKSDGGHRLILNLKRFNDAVVYQHFKMDSIKTVLQLITPNCYMCKADLKEAYYSVKVDETYQRFLKFTWRDQLYKYVCLPNGLASCPRRFPKLLKVPLSVLRFQGITLAGYIDDFFTTAPHDSCQFSVNQVVSLCTRLGFVIHPTKSILVPQQEIVFLGFVIHSVHMTVSLTPQKKATLKKLVNQLLTIRSPTIRFLAKVLGKLIASFPGSKYGPLYYRSLDIDKNQCTCYTGRVHGMHTKLHFISM